MVGKLTDKREELAAEAARVRAAGALGRSDLTVRLFDFLLACSLEGRSPKEVELAQEVFGKAVAFEALQDASVRVYIHRLRRKLSEFYTSAPAGAERLIIPRGGYRLELATPDLAQIAEEAVATAEALEAPKRPRLPWLIGGALAALVALNLAGWFAFTHMRPANAQAAVVSTTFWSPLRTIDRPMFVMIGDQYAFGEALDGETVSQVIENPSINSREDLDAYLRAHPEQARRYIDINRHVAPMSTGPALRTILPLVDGLTPAYRGRAPVLALSELTPSMLKKGHVIYIGLLGNLRMLREPLIEGSGFTLSSSGDELVDKASGRRFTSSLRPLEQNSGSRRDYGYFAGIPGPSGNRIIVIAGTSDAAVMQMAELVSDAKQLERIAARTGEANTFEALYEVSSIGDVNVGSDLILARPLRDAGIWQPGAAEGQQAPATAAH